MKRLTTCFITLASLILSGMGVQASSYLFDMGTSKSAVWQGFTAVTPDSVYSETTGFGWQSKTNLKAYDRAYTNAVTSRRSEEDQPPIWTNPITEDFIASDKPNTFEVKAAPGSYELYIVCGASDYFRHEFFDFIVRVGTVEKRVQIEGNYQFRVLRFKTTLTNGPLSIEFSPRSKWLINAIMVWSPSDSNQVETEIIKPFEEWTFRLPPQEWAKWKEDPEPESGPEPAWSNKDRERGFAVFSRPYLECIYPHTQPRSEDLNPELRLFATPSEYEPCNFVVRPLRDLNEAKITVSDIGPIRAADIEICHVRYMLARPNYTVVNRYRVVPDILEKFDVLELKANENARFWLTIHIPDTAPPGNYEGKITFQCREGKTTIPLKLRVLPIHLREDPEKIFGIYYHHPLDSMASASDEVSKEYFRRKADLEYADMSAHGVHNVVLSIWSPPADAQGNFRFNWDILSAKLELGKKYNFKGPIALEINTDGIYQKYMKERFRSHLQNIKPPPESFSRELTAMVQAIEAERIKRGWPEFFYYPIDEPSTDPAAVEFMVTVLKACRAAKVRTYVTADPTLEQYAPLKQYVDIWCTQPFLPDRETVLADTKARHVEYWCYPNHVNGENDHTPVTGARMTYGFGFWRSGFRTLIPWIYSASSGDPFNYLDGSTMDFFNRSEPDGTPMPVVLWEAYREGYDDYRYIYTLEQLIKEARTSSNPKALSAATTASGELQSIWDAIHVQSKYKDKGMWSPTEFDVYRWIVANQILSLQDALKKN